LYSVVNSSFCDSRSASNYGQGSVFSSNMLGRFNLSYGTVFGCAGLSGIWSRSSAVCDVCFCNFHSTGNIVSTGAAVIWSEGLAMVLLCKQYNRSRHRASTRRFGLQTLEVRLF
jgi:hypothetical protein